MTIWPQINADRSDYGTSLSTWNVESGDRVWTIEGHKFDINGLVFTRDDKLLLTGSVDTTIKFWDMKTGRESRTISIR